MSVGLLCHHTHHHGILGLNTAAAQVRLHDSLRLGVADDVTSVDSRCSASLTTLRCACCTTPHIAHTDDGGSFEGPSRLDTADVD